MERKFKGIWIPAALWESKELTLQEKCLIAEIDSFTVFFMSNKVLADFMGVSKRRVQQIIMGLSERGIVDVNTINDPDTGQIIKCTCQQKLDTKLKKSGIKNESMYKIHQLF